MRSVRKIQGQYIMDMVADQNAQRGLASVQILQFYQAVSVYYDLLRAGELQAFSDTIAGIAVDGIIITSAIVTQLQSAAQTYVTADSDQ